MAQGMPATLPINSNQPGSDIQVDGMFAGDAPTTIRLAPGIHKRCGPSVWTAMRLKRPFDAYRIL
jgi:hypothetical protein